MAGAPRKRAKLEAIAAAKRAAELAELGDPEAAAAAIEAGRLAEKARKISKELRDEEITARVVEKRANEERLKQEKKERDGSVLGAVMTPIAAPAGVPAELTEDEYEIAASVIATCSPEGALSGVQDISIFLGAVFPGLGAMERVRAARYLAALANAELRPKVERGAAGDQALTAAGIPYTAFEAMRAREPRFASACDTLTAARRRAVMNMLEESLMRRAFDGQKEETVTRAGVVVGCTKFDNRLAFDLLRFNHEHYVKTGKGDGGGGGMTLMIANGVQPVTQVGTGRTPKTIEAQSAGMASR